MKNNQSILKKIENLLKPESTILVDLRKKIDDNTDIVIKKEKSISDKKQKIANIQSEIKGLNEENAILTDAFNALKDQDLKLITNVLKLNLDVNKDLNKLNNQLPLQLEIRNNDINDLENSIALDEEKLTAAKESISKLNASLEEALHNQSDLTALMKEASSGVCTRTRNDVTEILKKLEFSNDEAYTAAKLIMFPEDELIPFFKDFKFVTEELAADETYVDLDNIVDALKDVSARDIEDDTDTKEENASGAEKEVEAQDFLSNFETNIFDLDDKSNEENSKTDSNNRADAKNYDNELDKAFEVDNEATDEKKDETLNPKVDEGLEVADSKEDTIDKETDTTSDYQRKLEDETPISFEELKNLFEANTEDKKEETKDSATDNSDALKDDDEIISLDELQNRMNDIFADLNVAEESPNILNSDDNLVTSSNEGDQNSEKMTAKEINFDATVLSNLGKSNEDISLIKPFATENLDVKNIKERLANKKINTSLVSSLIYKNGFENYLENIDTLCEFGYKPSEMELQKNGVLLSLISNANLEKNLKTLKDYKIDLKNTSGHIAFNVLAVEPLELIRRIDLILESNKTDLITYDINALSLDVDNILLRIAFCKEYNIPYTEEKNNILIFNSYIFKQDVLEELVEKEVVLEKKKEKLTDKLKEVCSSEAVDILDNNLQDVFAIKLADAKKFDEYTRLEQKLESICVCKGNAYIIDGMYFSHQNTRRNLITLVNNNNGLNDKDILIASLFYNSVKTLEDLKRVKESL